MNCSKCGHNYRLDGGQCAFPLAVVAPGVTAAWNDTHCGCRCTFPAPETLPEQPERRWIEYCGWCKQNYDFLVQSIHCPHANKVADSLVHADSPPVAQQPVEQCTWQVDDATDGEIWETDCGNAFVFESDGPTENKMKFCAYCGRPLKEVRIAYDYQD